MKLIGLEVKHIQFGSGIIEKYDGKYIDVRFYEKKVIKKFMFPNAFTKFLSTSDSSIELELDKKNKEKIIYTRGINHLVHFTNIKNLHSILTYGLIPVSEQSSSNIESFHNDLDRLDQRLNCTSLSIDFPNYKVFYKKRMENQRERWVVVAIDINILFSNKNTAYFCCTNAASGSITCIDENLCTSNAFEKMFADRVEDRYGDTVDRKLLNLSNNFTTNPQAEVLISNTISTEFIKGVYFDNNEDIESYKCLYGEENLKQYRYEINHNLFTYRNDYKFWR